MSQYPILRTKLYIPPIRPELVSRPRLIERLNAGLSFPRLDRAALHGLLSRIRDLDSALISVQQESPYTDKE